MTPTLQTLAAKARNSIIRELAGYGYPQTAAQAYAKVDAIILAALEQVHSAATEGPTVAKCPFPLPLRVVEREKDGSVYIEGGDPARRHVAFDVACTAEEASFIVAAIHRAADQPTPPTVQPEAPTAQAGETPADKTCGELSCDECNERYEAQKIRIASLERELNEAKRAFVDCAQKLAIMHEDHAPAPAALPEVREAIFEALDLDSYFAHSPKEYREIIQDKLTTRVIRALQPHLASAREDGALRFSVEFAGDKDAGLFPFNDVITIACDSRDWGSLEPEAVDIFTDALKEFYDGASVTCIDAARAKEQP